MANKKVLVVDNDKEFLSELEETLAMAGYDLIAVLDPRETLETLRGLDIYVALLDLKMPGMSGFELARELSQLPRMKNVPIIAMTGHYSEEMGPLMRLCGISKCLKKPFFPLEVIASIEAATVKTNDS